MAPKALCGEERKHDIDDDLRVSHSNEKSFVEEAAKDNLGEISKLFIFTENEIINSFVQDLLDEL
jgi:hypothetical protein